MKLVLNHGSGQIQSLTTNLVPKKTRLDTLEGKEYLVVPMIILTEGVHTGSSGAMYYPSEELSKTPVVWNHKPVVVYHPEMNGQGISACDPSVINTRKVGLMMNTVWKKGKLHSEAWLDRDRSNAVDDRIMSAVEAGEMMELSTGVFVDMEQEEGEWKGKAYAGIARNYRPDHLALLPDKIGACSIADGAGFLRNQDVAKVLGKPALSIFSNFIIYEQDSKLYRISYTSNEKGVKLGEEEPVEVKRVVEYRTLDGAFVGNQHQGENMNKKELIDKIVSNEKSGFKKEDEIKLNGFSEEQLNCILNAVTPPPPAPAPAAPPPAPAPAPAPAPVANQEKKEVQPEPAKIITLQDYLQAAPEGVREVLNEGMLAANKEKAELIAIITGNKDNEWTKEELGTTPLGQLRKMARLARGPIPQQQPGAIYVGQGQVPTGNTKEEEALEIPVMNFSK